MVIYFVLYLSGSPSQVLETWRMGKAGLELVIPMGLRNSDGSIVPLPAPAKTSGKNIPESLADAHYVGAKENVPTRVGELVGQLVIYVGISGEPVL